MSPGLGGTETDESRHLGFGVGRRGSAWNHDYPQADHHLPKIMREISSLDPQIDVSNVFELSDPELFTSPVAYISEVGTWGAAALIY